MSSCVGSADESGSRHLGPGGRQRLSTQSRDAVPPVMVRVIGWISLRRGTGSTFPQFVKQSCNEEAAEGEGSPRKRMPTKQEHRREHQQ